MVLPSLRRLFGSNKPVAARPRPVRRVRLALEALECRVVPATLHVGAGANEYHTITAAVMAASSGDTIKVDPGTYKEQVTIDMNSLGQRLDNLDLEGSKNTIIELPLTAPASQTTAIVEITAAQNVTINNFTIEGPGSGFGSIGYGIEVDGGASAVITNDHITAIRDNPLSGAQNGTGILVGGNFEAGPGATTGTAIISHDTIDDYQKRGIEVGDAGSYAEIDNTTVTGVGPTSLIAQNGIEIVLGASANINNDTVSGNVYTGTQPNTEATGILLYQSGAVTVDQNMLSQKKMANDVGISVYAPTGRIDIEQNQISGSTDDGIDLASVSGTGAVLSQNQISNSGVNGIDLDGVSGAFLSQNQISNSGVNGIALFDNSTGNDLDQNQSQNNGNDGIFVDVGSTGNTFNKSQLKKNVHDDAEDLSTGTGTDGTGNTWTNNKGKTSNPPGLVS